MTVHRRSEPWNALEFSASDLVLGIVVLFIQMQLWFNEMRLLLRMSASTLTALSEAEFHRLIFLVCYWLENMKIVTVSMT